MDLMTVNFVYVVTFYSTIYFLFKNILTKAFINMKYLKYLT